MSDKLEIRCPPEAIPILTTLGKACGWNVKVVKEDKDAAKK